MLYMLYSSSSDVLNLSLPVFSTCSRGNFCTLWPLQSPTHVGHVKGVVHFVKISFSKLRLYSYTIAPTNKNLYFVAFITIISASVEFKLIQRMLNEWLVVQHFPKSFSQILAGKVVE